MSEKEKYYCTCKCSFTNDTAGFKCSRCNKPKIKTISVEL